MRGHASAAGSGPGQGWPADLKAHLAYLSGGCIYTLGPQPGSTVRGNYCALDEAPVVGCFYHDNGSRGFVTSDNVADASGRFSQTPEILVSSFMAGRMDMKHSDFVVN